MKQVEKVLFRQMITVDFDDQEENTSIEELERIYARFEAEFTPEMLASCIQQTAEGLIDEIDMLEEDAPLAIKFDRLIKDMRFEHIVVYSDAFLLFLAAPSFFPEDEIIIQLNEKYEIEEMIVEDEDH